MLTKAPIFAQLDERPFAHCATLTDLGDAGLMAIWMGGSYETAPDVSLLASRLPRGADQWTAPKVLADVPGHSMGQPVLLRQPGGELWLFYNVIQGYSWETAIPYLTRSSDGGRTWDSPILLFDMPGLMLRSRAHIINGRIILPAYDENTWRSRMILSDDGGQSWRLTEPLESLQGNIHPNIVQSPDGRLLCYLRTGGKGGVIWRSESADNGDTWSELTPTRFPNANTGIDLLQLASGQYALAYNHSPTHRTPLCVAVTAGAAEDWQWRQVVDDEFVELSYPSLAQTDDGLIHLVYTHQRQYIVHAKFDLNWLMQGVSL